MIGTVTSSKNLKKENTFGIDSYAKYYLEATSVMDLKEILKANRNQEKLFVLGGGSNVLFVDNFDGLVIKIKIPGAEKIYEDEEKVRIEYGAGVIWNEIVETNIENNWGGTESLISIPGTIGGAVIQNIGAYGAELKDVFNSLKAIEISTLKETIFTKEQCSFGYRKSIFNSEMKSLFIITSVTLELSKFPKINSKFKTVEEEIRKLNKEKITIREVSTIIKTIRMNKLPDPYILGNAGSFFKNPLIDKEKYEELKKKYPDIPNLEANYDNYKIPTAWMIDKMGWKGIKLNETGTYINSPAVIVNYGKATGQEIYEFSLMLKSKIFEKYGIQISEEVNIISNEI
jgi:UDP-N-acetylmuramate dehydrogenase